ncbi:MAG: hypothetical protein AAF489_00210 [Bacteroidota bacterium]
MNIAERSEDLKIMLSQLDERLESFNILMDEMVSYPLDYEMESIRYVELVLQRLKNQIMDDKDIKKDAAFYVGETIRRNYSHAIWEVFEHDIQGLYGMPFIKIEENPTKAFFPFNAIHEFLDDPQIGFFFKQIKPLPKS